MIFQVLPLLHFNKYKSYLWACSFLAKNLSNFVSQAWNSTTRIAIGSTKGQLISKCFLGSSISSKKRTNKFDFTTMIPQVDLFSFVFWKKLKTPKRHFEINWPLVIFFCDNRKLSRECRFNLIVNLFIDHNKRISSSRRRTTWICQENFLFHKILQDM